MILYFIHSIFLIIISNGIISKTNEVFSLHKSIVTGPGLISGLSLPVRYFFIQCVDENGKNFTTTPPGELTVTVSGLQQTCQIWTQLLNVRDGSYITRYKLFNSCDGLHIEVKYNDKHIADSPYNIEGVVHHEHCFCPKPFSQWFDSMKCPIYNQIKRDLQPFTKVEMDNVLRDVLKRFNRPGSYSLCHYLIIKNEVYRKCYGQYVGFSMFMDAILLSLVRKVILPDVDFMVNLGDWPLEPKSSKNPIPIFSWCGSNSTYDIVMPTYDMTESTLEMMGRVMLDILSVHGNCDTLWEKKWNKAFWRGRDSRRERLDLIKLSRNYPDLINASLTNFFFFRDEEEEYGPKENPISFFQFFKYKYQINIDGTVAAYRFPYLLAGDSVVLKQESEYYEYFYNLLTPMVHYIPFKKDLSDLIKKLQWAKEHDNEARIIAQNAQQFAKENLLPTNIFCYYALLLKEYSALLDKKPEIHKDLELVPQPKDKPPCNCVSPLVKKVKTNEEL